MRRGLSAAIAMTAALGGCLLTTSLEGLVDSPPTSKPDGGGAPNDAGSQLDSAAATDAPLEGSQGGDAEATFRCAALSPAPTFCADFDTGTLSSNIGVPNTALGGEITLDATVSRSPSSSMKLTTPALTTGVGRAAVERNFGFAPLTSIVIELDIRIDSIDQTASNAVNIAMGGYALSLFLGGSAKIRQTIPVDGGAPMTPATDRTPPPLGVWFHLSLAVALADGASTVTLSYDGVAQSALPVVMEKYRQSSWSVLVGLNYISTPDDGHDLHIDNLVIDAK